MPRVPVGSLSPSLAHGSSLVAFSTRSKSDSKAVTVPLHVHSMADGQLHCNFNRMFEPVYVIYYIMHIFKHNSYVLHLCGQGLSLQSIPEL